MLEEGDLAGDGVPGKLAGIGMGQRIAHMHTADAAVVAVAVLRNIGINGNIAVPDIEEAVAVNAAQELLITVLRLPQ